MTNQSDKQADARSSTGKALNYEGDFLAYFDQQSVPAGDFNGRLLAWINQALGTSYTEINGAKVALANSVGIANWDSLNLLGGVGTSFPMSAWAAAKAAVAAGTSNATLIFGGTSMTMGAFSQPAVTFTNCRILSYPMQLLPYLANSLDQGWAGTNQTYSTETIGGYDPRFTSAANWGGLSGSNTLGGHLISNTTTTDPLTFAGATQAIDTIEAWGPLLAGLGVISCDVGGAALSPTVNEATGAPGYWHQTWTVPLGNYSTINFKKVSGNVYLGGFIAYNSAQKRILCHNAGMSGSKAADWADASLSYSPINALKARAPAMFVWEIGANDWANATNLTTFANAVQAVDDAVRSYGGDMIIMSSPPSDASVASLAAQQSYIDILASKAKANRRNFINNTTVFGSYVTGNANGYYANTVHLNGAGYGIMKDAPLALLAASEGVLSANALSEVKAKLNSRQNVVIFANGDSTAYEAFAGITLFCDALAQLYGGTFNNALWDEWNVSVPTGTKTYRAPVTTVYGTGPTITLYNASTPGQVSGYLWDGTRKATALDGIPTPDVCILHHGHNQGAFDIQAGGSLCTGVGLLLATVGMTSIQWPNVPQVITTQNPNRDDTAMNNMYAAYALAASAHPKLTRVDTYADFIAQGKASNLYRAGAPGNLHPSDATGAGNHDGGTLQANRLMATFNAAKSDLTYTTPGWPAMSGTNLLTNGDFSNWTGTFPVRVTANNGATATKDTVTKYGAAAYSMAILANGNGNASIQYSLSTAEQAAVAGKTVSAAILFRQSSTILRRGYFSCQLRTSNGSQGFPQGDLINCTDGWYMAVWSGIVCSATQDANDKFLMYPSFNTILGANDPLWVQKIMLVEGTLPMGTFP